MLSALVEACGHSDASPEPVLTSSTNPPTAVDIRVQNARNTLLHQRLIRDDDVTITQTACGIADVESLQLAPTVTCENLSATSPDFTTTALLLSHQHPSIVLFHEGHATCSRNFQAILTDDSRALIDRLLERADVLYIDLPLCGLNREQTIQHRGVTLRVERHEWFALLDSPGASSLSYFLAPLHAVVTDLASRYEKVSMVGLSGGGWATTLYAASDQRIGISISVAGTLPLLLRTPDADGRDDLGDWEQYGAYLYQLLDYEDLYALGATPAGRRHVQFFNELDSCCFSGIKGREAEASYRAIYGETRDVAFIEVAGTTTHSIPVDLVVEQLFADSP